MRAEELFDLELEDQVKEKTGKAEKAGVKAQPYKLPKQLPDFWYRSPGNVWYARDAAGVYRDYPLTQIRLLLLESGVRSALMPGETLSPLDRHLLVMRQQHVVSWAGELAGFNAGVHNVCDEKILVTKSPVWIKPVKGTWPALKTYLEQLLGEQLPWLYAWLKSALRSLYAGPPFRRGQVLALAGPVGCGKSLLQSVLTEVFGGRVARPFQYLMGDTAFNEDLLKAEHLMIEDEASSRDPRKRDFFGAALKNLVANDVTRAHPKGSKALYLQSFARVTISLNDQPENLSVLPIIRGDLVDKIILLRASQATFPYRASAKRGRATYRKQLSAELPAFLHFLTEWKIPSSMEDQRYGVKGYQDEELMGMLNEDRPELHLLELIDRLQPWDLDRNPWTGSAAQLEHDLIEKDRHGRVRQLLNWHGACGQLLARLSKTHKERVQKVDAKGHAAIWVIFCR